MMILLNLNSLNCVAFMQIDSNTDGFVDFGEFVAAALHVNQLEEHDSEKWQQRSRAAFEKFDIDGDGFITAEELRMVYTIICFLIKIGRAHV